MSQEDLSHNFQKKVTAGEDVGSPEQPFSHLRDTPIPTSTESPISRIDIFEHAREAIAKRARTNNNGENLPERLLIDREKIITELSHAIDAWVMKYVPEGSTFTQERLGALVQDIGETQRSLIDLLVAGCKNTETYQTRPNIKIYEGIHGALPDIWLLGWRENETSLEATDIHDHVASEAAFHVYQGCVDEIIYTFDHEKWKKDGEVLNCQKTTRGLRRGSTATIPAPYVHIVSDHRDLQEAVTIHSYYPPLREMNFYDEQNGILVPKGNWKEESHTDLHCGSCTMSPQTNA